MPGRSPERPAALVCSPECCPTNGTPAKTARGYSTVACSPTDDRGLAEPGTTGCKHNELRNCLTSDVLWHTQTRTYQSILGKNRVTRMLYGNTYGFGEKYKAVMQQIQCDMFSLSPKRLGLPNVISIWSNISALSTHLCHPQIV